MTILLNHDLGSAMDKLINQGFLETAEKKLSESLIPLLWEAECEVDPGRFIYGQRIAEGVVRYLRECVIAEKDRPNFYGGRFEDERLDKLVVEHLLIKGYAGAKADALVGLTVKLKAMAEERVVQFPTTSLLHEFSPEVEEFYREVNDPKVRAKEVLNAFENNSPYRAISSLSESLGRSTLPHSKILFSLLDTF